VRATNKKFPLCVLHEWFLSQDGLPWTECTSSAWEVARCFLTYTITCGFKPACSLSSLTNLHNTQGHARVQSQGHARVQLRGQARVQSQVTRPCTCAITCHDAGHARVQSQVTMQAMHVCNHKSRGHAHVQSQVTMQAMRVCNHEAMHVCNHMSRCRPCTCAITSQDAGHARVQS